MAEVRWSLVWLPVICFVAGAVGVLVSDDEGGLTALVQLRAQVENAQQREKRLEAEERRLARDIQRLREDAFSIEAAARRTLGMVRPGEIVVRLEPADEGG